jgi:cytochrome c oxidase assembly protein subunit 15
MLKTSKSQRFFRLALFSALFSVLLVVLSAWGRLNEAGLGCPEWPGCYGRLFAPLTAQELNEARAYFPRQPAEEEKLLKETLHRYLSGALGLLIIRLIVLGWQIKKHVRRQQVLIPGLVFVLVFAQVVLGILTVKLQHKPLIGMLHLSVGLSILGLLWWVVLRELRFWRPVTVAPAAVLRRLRPRALAGLLLVIAQIALGGWMSANYAALACPDFPTCQGTLWPAVNFVDGFTLWRDIGLQYEGVLLNLEAATAVHMAHRIGALVTLLYVGWLALHTMRLGARDNLCRYGLLVLVLLLAQVTLGVVTVLAHLPLVIAVAHHSVAALLMLSLITLNHVLRVRAT